MTNTISKFHRTIRDYLQDSYGLSGLQPVWGGSHPKFIFDYNGQQRTVILNRKAERTKGIDIKIQDINRELGPPPLKLEKSEPRKLENMMPDVTAEPFNPPKILSATKKEAVGTGSIASYQSNGCLTISLPPEIVKCLDLSTKFSLYKASKGFELKPNSNGVTLKRKTGPNHLFYTVNKRFDLTPPYFGVTKTELVAIDGHVLISFAETPIPVAARAIVRTPKKAKPSKPAPVPQLSQHEIMRQIATKIPTKTYVPVNSMPDFLGYLSRQAEITEDDAKHVLDCVKYIESRCVWRMHRRNTTKKVFFESTIE